MLRLLLQGTVLALLALASAWLLSLLERGVGDPVDELSHDPDFFMENFTTVRMNSSGVPRHQLQADRLVHYPDTDSNELTRPRIQVFGSQGRGSWHIQAEEGWVAADNNVVLLKGRVHIQRRTEQGAVGVEVTTRDLRVLLNDDFAESANPTLIKNASGEIRSVGMRAYLDERRLELLSQVKTHYEIKRTE